MVQNTYVCFIGITSVELGTIS